MDAVRSLPATALVVALFTGSVSGHAADPAHIELQAGFMPDPHTAQLTLAGHDPASSLAANCPGYVDASRPSAVIRYQALADKSQLGIFTAAGVDTVLVIEAPDGSRYCNDDSDFLASGAAGLVMESAVSGDYLIWVGTYEDDTQESHATLAITEYGPSMWLTLNLEAGYDGLLMNIVSNDIEFGDDSGEFANDGECDDPRLIGPGMSMMPPFDHERRDASDCRVLFGLGEVRLGRPQQR